jgi:enediyne biosynthesis protein E4
VSGSGVFRNNLAHRVSRRAFLNRGSFASLAALFGPEFKVKLPRGIDFTPQNSPTPQKYLIETMPGGVVLFDYNGDGLLDVFLVNGGRLRSPMPTPENFERRDPRYWNQLGRRCWR